MALVEIDGVVKAYGTGAAEVQALRGVSLTIEPGEFTVISGPSGSGKSTLLNLIGCLDAPTRGRVSLEGQDLSSLSPAALAGVRARRIGFIFQSFNLIPVLSARENVELALQLAGDQSPDRGARTSAILEHVGLGALGDRRPNQLSGGQQQRVAVARALVKKPALIIADEPTANLDSKIGKQILDLMRDMNEKMGVTFLFSTHDPQVMERAKRVITLTDGTVTSDEQRPVA
ncbi:MAG: ABC transporter ATP-binding protein [Deltaproteobacteria bacterium]|nr:ABC transporter ATP-binding protein [Deltaproteobacteria bacterium]